MTFNITFALDMEEDGLVASAKLSKDQVDQLAGAFTSLSGASQGVEKSTDSLGDSLRRSGDDAKKQADQIQRLTTMFNPLQAATDRYEQALADLKTAQEFGIVNSRQYGEQLRSLEQVYDRQVKEISGVAEAERASAATKRQLQASAQGIKDSLDPLLPVQRAYENQIRQINQAHAAGLLTQSEATAALGRSRAAYQEQSRQAQLLAKNLGQSTAAYRQIGPVAQQAGYQVGDFFVQVASGQNVVVAGTQQLSQLLGFFGSIGAIAGAGAAVLGALYLGISNVGGAAAEASEDLDKYRASLEKALSASRDAEADAGSLPDRLKNKAIAEIEDSLGQEDALLKELNAKLEELEQRETRLEKLTSRARGTSALTRSSSAGGSRAELREVRRDIADLTKEFDASSERVESYNARLAVLRDTLGDAKNETKEKTAAIEGLNERLDLANRSLLAVAEGGLEGAAAFDRLADAEKIASEAADQYNKQNERLIALGQLQKKTQDDYLEIAKRVVAAETEAAEKKKELVAAGKDEDQQRKAALKAIDDEFKAYDKLLVSTDDLIASKQSEAERIEELTAALKVSNREYLVVSQVQAIMAADTLISAEAARELAEAIVDANLALGELREHQGALKSLVEQYQTPLESYVARMRELEELRPFAKTPAEIEAIDRAMRDANEELRQAQIEADGFSSALRDAADQITSDFQNLFADIFENGFDSAEDFADGLLNIFQRLAAQLATSFVLGDILGLTDSLGVFEGTAGSGLSSLISPTSVLGKALDIGSGGSGGGAGLLSPLNSAGNFFSNLTSTGSLTSGLVYSPAGLNLGLSQAIPGAANGAIASGSGIAPTALGSGILQAGSLAVAPFIGMGIAALASIALRQDKPRSAAQLGVQDGLFGVERVDVGNGGDPAIGQGFGDNASALGNAFLEAAGLRLSPSAVLGMLGLDQSTLRSTTGSGAYDYDAPDQLGIYGLTRDGRSFSNNEDGQRAAIADFVSRNLLRQLLDGGIDGLTESAEGALKVGLGNLARGLEGELSESGFEDFARRLDILANWDDMVAGLNGLDSAAEDAARRLETAAETQRAFNDQVAAYKSEAEAAIAETGSGISGLRTFLSDADALFNPYGSDRTQIRLNLAGANEGSIDGNGTVFTSGGEGGGGQLNDLFTFGTVRSGEGQGDPDPGVIRVFGEEIRTIDETLGEGGRLIDAFKSFNDGMAFSVSELTDVLENAGAEVPKVLDAFFDVESTRDYLRQSGEIVRNEVASYFDQLTGSAVAGPIQLFEEIVPPLSDITKSFLDIEAQIEATRPDLEALNEDLRKFGQEVIDIDKTLGDASGKNAQNAQDQFLASLGIAVGADGNVQSAEVDFGGINSLATQIAALDLNAVELFANDPRGLMPQVSAEIDAILRDGLLQLLNSAEDYGTTLEQIEKIFGDRLDGLDLTAGGSTRAAGDFNAAVNRQLLQATDPKTVQLLDLIETQRAERRQAEILGADTTLLEKLHNEQVDALLGLTGAVNDNTDAKQSEIDSLEDLTSSLSRAIPRLEEFGQSLPLNRDLSILTPQERYEEARRRYEEARDAAQGGDLSSIEQLPDLAEQFLQVSREVNAANDNYRADYLDVTSTISESTSIAIEQLDVANEQLELLRSIDGGISDALGNLTADQDLGANPALNALLAAASGYAGDFGDGGFQAAANAFVSANNVDLGNSAGRNSVLSYITGYTGPFGSGGFMDNVGNLSEIQREAARAWLLHNGITPGFFYGGQVLNGSTAQDSVFAPMLAGNEYVINNASVAKIGVPTLDYMNVTGEVPGGNSGPDADRIVAAIHAEGDATRQQMRDESEYQAGYLDGLRASFEDRAEADHRAAASVPTGRMVA